MSIPQPSSLLQLPPLSLYVHIPWCVRKCPYCDFNSHVSGDIPESSYVDQLVADLHAELANIHGRKLISIFFGGGTPSLFAPQSIARVLEAAQASIGFAPDIEITLEANPGTVEQQKFAGYRQAGINRLSIGVQSFAPRHLQALGRIHGRDEALVAVDAARAAGFDNLNLDLMHGLPDQTPQEALADLHQALALAPNHLSWYQLTIEPNTEFYKQPPLLPDDDRLADIQGAGEELLADADFHQYEISAYAAGGRHSVHNTHYWRFGDYIGIGAGAHSKLTDPVTGTISRHWKTRLPAHYLRANESSCREAGARTLTAGELPLEFAMNALRLNEGFDFALFEGRTGLARNHIATTIDDLQQRGLLQCDRERVATTPAGRAFLNDILAEF